MSIKDQTKVPMSGTYWVIIILSYIVNIILSVEPLRAATLPFSFDNRWLIVSNLAADSYNRPWMNLVIFNFVTYIAIALFAIVLFVSFVKQSKYATYIMISFFMFRILIITLSFYFQTVIKGPATPGLDEILSKSLRALVIPGLIIPYMLLSEKVREIFKY
jgi:hypothetical protein